MAQYLHTTSAHPPIHFKASIDYLQHLMQVNSVKQLSAHRRFKFGFVELSQFFFASIFNPQLVGLWMWNPQVQELTLHGEQRQSTRPLGAGGIVDTFVTSLEGRLSMFSPVNQSA